MCGVGEETSETVKDDKLCTHYQQTIEETQNCGPFLTVLDLDREQTLQCSMYTGAHVGPCRSTCGSGQSATRIATAHTLVSPVDREIRSTLRKPPNPVLVIAAY